MRYVTKLALTAALLACSTFAFANDEVALFDGTGKAQAYIALGDEMTIFLWGGKPVAYLDRDSAGGFHIYGFNGKHLGWFVKGVARDHDGKAACAVKEQMGSTEFEPFKAFKEFKPFKGFKVFAPFRPFFATSWGDTPCRVFLAEGGA